MVHNWICSCHVSYIFSEYEMFVDRCECSRVPSRILHELMNDCFDLSKTWATKRRCRSKGAHFTWVGMRSLHKATSPFQLSPATYRIWPRWKCQPRKPPRALSILSQSLQPIDHPRHPLFLSNYLILILLLLLLFFW
jgi:hypothetical protein